MSDETTPIAVPTRHWRPIVDLASAYALSVARVASMAAIVAILFRYTDPAFTAAFVLCRTMLGVLSYVFSGLGPAVQNAIASRKAAQANAAVALPPDEDPGRVLPYRAVVATASRGVDPTTTVYVAAMSVALFAAVIAVVFVGAYAESFDTVHAVDATRAAAVRQFAFAYGLGLLARLVFEPASAVLQSRGLIALDNLILIAAELAWAWLAWQWAQGIYSGATTFDQIAATFGLVNVIAGFARMTCARLCMDGSGQEYKIDVPLAGEIAGRAFLISVASFADFLYAPFNLVLLNAALGAVAVADYTPALQFDGALLLLVAAIAATMLPRAMRLAGERRHAELRVLYLRATLSSLAILTAAAVVLWLAAPMILQAWLGRPMPATLAVLPFVLVHTVLGGTAGVGRATLLAMGRFRVYTASAIVGGIANVALALLFVVGFGWGLRGVALATAVAVLGRCAIWMPWYILRSLRADEDRWRALTAGSPPFETVVYTRS